MNNKSQGRTDLHVARQENSPLVGSAATENISCFSLFTENFPSEQFSHNVINEHIYENDCYDSIDETLWWARLAS